MITLDPFYSVSEYLDALDALRFNDIDFNEYIDLRSKLWYIDIDNAVTHKFFECHNDRLLAQKVRPLETGDEKALERRVGDTSLERYLDNDCLEELRTAGHSATYVFLTNANEAATLSTKTGLKIWWFGRYLNGQCICACARPPVGLISGKIAMVPTEVGLFDVETRRLLLEYRDFLRKYTKQPYFKDGRFYSTRGRRVYDY